jgi:sugar phosphate isomerase/epimerase
MAKKHRYRFCFGPWNISEGQDPYGPTTRPPQSFDWKLAQLKKHGFDAMMFHDDDAVPDIDAKSEAQIRKEAKELRKRLDGFGIAAEMVAPRLWFAPETIDGAYTSNDPKCRRYAIERSLRSIDIASLLDTDILVLWLAREGTYIREAKNARRCIDWLVEAFDRMLAHDKKIRLSIEPKPNEPISGGFLEALSQIRRLTSAVAKVPSVVVHELCYQKTHAALRAAEIQRKHAETISQICGIVAPRIPDLHSLKSGCKKRLDDCLGRSSITVIDVPVQKIDWQRIIESACWRIAPFEKPKSEDDLAEKGCRDCLIIESIVHDAADVKDGTRRPLCDLRCQEGFDRHRGAEVVDRIRMIQ